MCDMGLPKPHFYPAAVAALSSLTFVAVVAIGVANGHVSDWPHISDIASRPPESCIFAFSINLCSVLIACLVYVRFKEVQAHYRINWVRRQLRAVNKVGLYVGWVSTLAFSVAATFQVSSVKVVHFVGALTGFGLGIVYLWFQVFASYHLKGIAHGKTVLVVRTVLAFLATYSLVIAIVAAELASCHGDTDSSCSSNALWVRKVIAHPSQSLHIVSSLHEWFLVAVFNAFYLTFVKEFKNVTLDYPSIVARISDYQTLDDDQSMQDSSS